MLDSSSNEKERERRIEFEFPLLLVRIRSFMRLYERLGAWKISRVFSWINLVSMPIMAGFGLYLVINTLFILITTPEAREIGRQLGMAAYIPLPGINPLLPIIYGWIAIIIGIIVHEGAHGVIARSIGIKVKSSVLLFFLAIPIAAGVDLDEEQMERAKFKDYIRVLAAGIGANIIVGLTCIVGVMIITSGLSPIVDGLYITNVMEGMPAEEAGLLVGDVIVMVNDKPITILNDLKNMLENKTPGEIVQVTVARGEMWGDRLIIPVNLTEYEGKPYLGVVLGEMLIRERLRLYQKLSYEVYSIHFQPPTLGFSQNLIPFSEALHIFYAHPLGEHWYILANVLFWVWYINITYAIFNALPIYPLDGGRTFKKLLSKVLAHRASETMISRLTYAVTIVLISVVVAMIIIPFIL